MENFHLLYSLNLINLPNKIYVQPANNLNFTIFTLRLGKMII